MAQTYRSRQLGIHKENERAMGALYRQLAAAIAAEVTRRAAPDGSVPRESTLAIQSAAGQLVTNFFLGTNRAGQLAPFEPLPDDSINPLSPYMRQLWLAIRAAVRVPVEQNAAQMAQRLPPDILARLRTARIDPLPIARQLVAESVFRPNPLAAYEAPHQWVDPAGYRLSDRVWNTSADTRRQIDQFLEAAIREGRGALDISRLLAQFLTPGEQLRTTNKPYGRTASYSGMRLARTEITHAAGAAAQVSAAMNPFVAGMQWRLSPSHPKPDVCDGYARGGPNGDGIYEIGATPPYPAHPNCLCWLGNVMVEDPDAILEALRDEIRSARAELTDKVGPIATNEFSEILLGRKAGPVTFWPGAALPAPAPKPPRALPAPKPKALPAPKPKALPAPKPAPAADDEPDIQSAPDSANLDFVPTGQQIDLVDGKVRSHIKSMSDMFEIDPAVIEAGARKTLKELTEAHPVAIQFSSQVLDDLLDAGRFKTQFEDNVKSGGKTDREKRMRAEENGLGIPSTIDPLQRPIYGYVRLPSESQDFTVDAYGDLAFILKDSVKARATVTTGDSLNDFATNNLAGSPLRNPQLVSLGRETPALYDFSVSRSLDDLVFNISYLEVQIQKGVSLKDVSRVIDTHGKITPEQIKRLHAQGIDIERAGKIIPRATEPEAAPEAAPEPMPPGFARRLEAERKRAEEARLAKEAEQTGKIEAKLKREAERLARADKLGYDADDPVWVRSRMNEIDAEYAPRIAEYDKQLNDILSAYAKHSATTEQLYEKSQTQDGKAKERTQAKLAEEKVAMRAVQKSMLELEQAKSLLHQESNSKIEELINVRNPANVSVQSDVTDPALLKRWQAGANTFNRLVSDDVAAPTAVNFKQWEERAKYRQSEKTVYVGSLTPPATVAHELAHWLEHSNPDVFQRSVDFFNRRTVGEQTAPLSYSDDGKEVGKKDKFLHEYMGREYKTAAGKPTATEILSMGLDYMTTKPLELARKDPDYFDFVFNSVRGR